ncbi:MAG: T9SS type A sorting domain-containing protein [Bacteroidota bacterium]|nr:T9SS type A sorting domain-containing protein [Bacteroidota bacterium]
MKYKILILVFHLLILTKIVFPQINFYDSILVVASSDSFEYKNPVFDNNKLGFSDYHWLTYERHTTGTSDIIIRAANYNGYGPEIVLTNSMNSLNLNPSGNKNFLVWQSNQRGYWNLYFSAFTNSSYWSSPLIIDSNSVAEIVPNILFSSSGNYFVVCKKNNNIGFRRYNAVASVWDRDTVLTSGDSIYSAPLLFKQQSASGYCIAYLKILSTGRSILYQRFFNESFSGEITWDEPFEVQQPNSQENLTSTFSHSQNITYSYDTLGNKNIIGLRVVSGGLKEIFTKNVPGNHYLGKGSLMGIITDNPFFYFSVFSSLTKANDSSQITFINRPSTSNNDPQYKKIYLGDTNTITKMDLSGPIFELSGGGHYRIKSVWEEIVNGKTNLVESFMTDILNNVSNQNFTIIDFNLYQNYPNPFNPKTVIRYSLIGNGYISLKVFDILGNEVTSLVNEKQNAGSYRVDFNGEGLPSGIYFYKLEARYGQAGDFVETKRMILLK